MGVASGMPADPELLPILLKLKIAGGALAGSPQSGGRKSGRCISAALISAVTCAPDLRIPSIGPTARK